MSTSESCDYGVLISRQTLDDAQIEQGIRLTELIAEFGVELDFLTLVLSYRPIRTFRLHGCRTVDMHVTNGMGLNHGPSHVSGMDVFHEHPHANAA